MTKAAHILVIGNEKGGTGKSTLAMHLIVSLLAMGARVGSIDLDARQATLSRYLDNRRHRADRRSLPDHVAVPPTGDAAADAAKFLQALARLQDSQDVIVIDTPGSDHALSRLAHGFADTLVTPLNDSFIDLDVLAMVDRATMTISRPSHYSEMVWEARKARAQRGVRSPAAWFVLRNRLSMLDARNKRDMERLLTLLAKRIGFRMIDGLCERVVYRELFLDGLTLLDLGAGGAVALSLSHVAARQELRRVIDGIGLAGMISASPEAVISHAGGAC